MDDFDFIKEELKKESNYVKDYSITAKIEGDSYNYEVSRFVNNKQDIEDFRYKGVKIKAITKSGYEQLREMGFTHKEIKKEYGDNERDKS